MLPQCFLICSHVGFDLHLHVDFQIAFNINSVRKLLNHMFYRMHKLNSCRFFFYLELFWMRMDRFYMIEIFHWYLIMISTILLCYWDRTCTYVFLLFSFHVPCISAAFNGGCRRGHDLESSTWILTLGDVHDLCFYRFSSQYFCSPCVHILLIARLCWWWSEGHRTSKLKIVLMDPGRWWSGDWRWLMVNCTILSSR